LDIQICQCCGIIIRGKSKFCTGCGTTISKFSPVTLPVISHTAAPLAVILDPDPLVLERTMLKVRFAGIPVASAQFAQGGEYGNDQDYGQSQSMAGASQAAATSTSRLQNILGNAATRGGAPVSDPMSELISLDAQEQTQDNDSPEGFDEYLAEDEQEYVEEPSNQEADFEPPSTPEPSAPFLAESQYSSPATNMPGSPTRPDRPGTATVTRIVTAAGAFDALAGSTSATIPITVTSAVNPLLGSGSLMATNLSSAQNAVAFTSAEPPGGLPRAGSVPHATTVVAPQTGAADSLSAGPPAESVDSRTIEPAAFAETRPELPFSMTPEASQFAAPQPADPTSGPADFFDTPPPAMVNPPTATFDSAPPLSGASPSSAAAPTVATSQPTLAVAPPMLQPQPTDVVSAPSTSFEPVASSPTAESSFNPIAGGNSFDFFAPTPGLAPFEDRPPEPPTLVVAEPTVTPTAEPKPERNVIDTNKFGNGVPSVVADAIRAAASASQTNMQPVSAKTTSDEAKGDFPDDSVNRKKKKSDDKEDNAGSTVRGNRDYKESSKSETSKTFKLGPFDINMKSGLTIGLLVLFLGLPMMLVGFNIVGGAISKLFSPGGSSVPWLGGDWEFGVLSSDGRNVKGTVNLQQKGAAFTGMGVDSYGGFRITNGVYQYPKLQFQKIYVDQQGRPQGKSITYAGAVDWVNPDPNNGKVPFLSHMYGQWQFQKREGHGWRGQVVSKSGKWEAGQVRVDAAKDRPEDASGNIAMVTGFDPGQSIKDFIGVPKTGSASENATFFARIAGFLLLAGLGLVAASAKFFGPAGLLNIWSKKEYIPSQFKSQHYKMVKELGNPVKVGGLPFGWRADWHLMQCWWPRQLALTPELRNINPHVLLLGAGSKGKSRLMASMIYHDIESNDRAVVVIDSDGGLIDLLMNKIASSHKGAEIARRMIIIDPTHGGEVYAYNPLEYPDDGDLQNAASAVVFGFKAIYTEPPGSQSQWNQQTANILRNSAILLMANGMTLTDLPKLLSENDFRDVLLDKVEGLKGQKAEYTTLLEAWGQYKRLARTDQWINWVEPILNRVQPMLGDPRIRPILTKPKGDLNLKEIINEGKILFVKVPQGQLDQNANLLGSLIVTGLKQAAMSLSLKGGSRRHPCALYLDEFESFIEKETYDAITSETKKFQIGFIGASKTLQGLPEDYRAQLIINVGTMCCFALAKKDGDILGPQMFRVDGRKIKHQTLQNIFNKVNTSPQFELISDEEKLNIDRVVGQEERHYYCYRVGTVAGVFQMRCPDFDDVPDKDVNWSLTDQIYARSVRQD